MKSVLFIGSLLSALVYCSAEPVAAAVAAQANGGAPRVRDCQTTGCLNGDCVAAGAVSRCICRPGFILNPVDTSICSDIDECRVAGGQICGYGRCVNRPGGWQCQCYPNSYPINGGTYCRYSPWYGAPGNQNSLYNPFSWIWWSMVADNM